MLRSIIHFFLSMGMWGLLGMGVLDSSILFLPFGNDLLIVALTAKQPARWWLYAIAAAAGSLLGCAITDFLSRKLGEVGLEKMVNSRRLESVQRRLKKHTLWVLGLAALMPPPFPFTIFLIGASALQISRWRVLTAVAAGRLVRFAVLGLLAARFGTWILRVSKRDEFEYFMLSLAVISIVGSIFSVLRWVRSSRSGHRGAAQQASAEA
jgi:membrane protein YqaA with SNARE-associated domain